MPTHGLIITLPCPLHLCVLVAACAVVLWPTQGDAGMDAGGGEGVSRGPAFLAPGLMRVRCTAAGTEMCWGQRVHPSALPVAQQQRPPLPPLDFLLQLLPGGTEAATSPGAAAAGGGGGADKERAMKPGARLLLVPAGVEWQQVRLQNRSQQHHHQQQQQGKPPSGAAPAGGKGASGTGMGKTIIKIKPRLKVPGTAEAGGAPAGTSPGASGSRVTPPEGHTANLACLSGDTLQVIGWLPPAAEQQLQQVLTAADVQGGPPPGAPAASGTPPAPPVPAAPTAAGGESTPGGAATCTLGAAGWLRLWQQGVLQRLQLRVQAVQRPTPPQEQQQQMAPPCVALWQVQEHAAGMLELGASCGAVTQQVERVWVRVRAGVPPVAVQ